MRFVRFIFAVLCIVTFCLAPAAHAQKGHVHFAKAKSKAGGVSPDSEPALGSLAIYIVEVAGSPNGIASSIVDCNADNPNIVADGYGDCYVQTDAYGNFNLTDAYSCTNDSEIIYFEAVGGTVGGTENDQLSLVMLPSSSQTCGYYFNNSSTAFVYIGDYTNVMAGFGAGVFATTKHSPVHNYDSFGVYNSTADHQAFMNALDYVNSVIPSSTGTYAGSDSNVQNQLNTLADVDAYCIDSAGGTTSGTQCGTLFSDTTQGSFQAGTNQAAPINTWMAMASMAQDPANNVSTQYGLIAANPYGAPWTPYDSAAPSMWGVPVNESTQPYINPSTTVSSATHNTGSSQANKFLVNGSNLIGPSGLCPTVVVAGYVASVVSTSCTSSSVQVVVPKFTNKGSLAVYADGVASSFIPFVIN